MALTTFSELKTAIGSWLGGRTDSTTTGSVPDFIKLTEARLNRLLRCEGNHTTSTLTIAAESVAVPSDLAEVDTIRDGTTRYEYYPPQAFADARRTYVSGLIRIYTRRGGYFLFLPAPSTSVDATLDYWQKITGLSDSDTSNWVLTNHPDLYLFGALLEAAPFLDDDQRVPLWQARFDLAVNELKAADQRSATGAAPVPRHNRPFGG